MLTVYREYSYLMLNRWFKNFGKRATPALPVPQILDQCRERLAQAKFEEAIRTLDGLLARAPDIEEAWFLRGTAFLESGNPTRALPDLARAADMAPAEPRYQYNLAVAHWMQNDSDEAARCCRKALELNNDFPQAHILLANASLPGEPYTALLARIQQHLRPRTYLEIGVFKGESIKLAQPTTLALGVDPHPKLPYAPPPNMRIYAQTSDDFFARSDLGEQLQGLPLDLGFIDGMHYFDFALRDFINMERLSAPGSTILVHDCFPLDRYTAARERVTDFWSGDVWRLVVLLKKYRPDLAVNVIATPVTGLGLIRNLDPSSRILADNLAGICEEFMGLDYAVLDEDKVGQLNLFPNDWEKVKTLLDANYFS
ncbi:MAG: tetratricopeptide repeat protein [Burkholderiales bacterium]